MAKKNAHFPVIQANSVSAVRQPFIKCIILKNNGSPVRIHRHSDEKKKTLFSQGKN
ncbi:hypothetical protein [Alteribacillus sp. HJP-4]|uniref:hypothetical protein n=1 Tax=Alteribacillus sp. HJP-4 TaxID=2775394 RepID=UPI0035CCCD39